MASIPVIVKHQGKKYDVDLDPSSLGEVLKFQLYSLTGVEPDRQKIIIKGGQLKDDTDLSTLGAKPGQTFMMMGTPSGAGGGEITRPKETIKFVEDMTEEEAAQQVGARPAGLTNLGNTCYLNSTLQTLKLVPELHEHLKSYAIGEAGGMLGLLPTSDLTASLRDLYQGMSKTQEEYQPIHFLQVLRTAFPQFSQKSKSGPGFAQQDAEEAWSQILFKLRGQLKTQDKDGEGSFVDKYMAGRFTTTTECDEQAAKDAGEEPSREEDTFLKLNCHITASTNHLHDGLVAALEEKIEKRSSILDRDAIYTRRSKIARLPKYLTVHFVRFFWKREAQKKAKIMRKVTFPKELDVADLCTDELKAMLIPVRDKVREVRKDEEDVQRARKKQKRAHDKAEADKAMGITSEEKGKSSTSTTKKDTTDDVEMAEATYKTDAEVEAERLEALHKAKRELYALINADLAADEGANASGLYELRGVVTHQGASADSGHYTAYVKKVGEIVDAATGRRGEEDGKWWWFNDEKVSEVEADKIETLAGGGESHSALILLYKSLELPRKEDVQ